jgi:hypothetical protein
MNRRSLLQTFLLLACGLEKTRANEQQTDVLDRLIKLGVEPVWDETKAETRLSGVRIMPECPLTDEVVAILNTMPTLEELWCDREPDKATMQWLSRIRWHRVSLASPARELRHLKIPNLRVFSGWTEFSAEEAAHLVRNHPDIRELSLFGSTLDDDGLAEICKLRGLWKLEAPRTKITDAGTKWIGDSKLRVLDVSQTECSGAGFQAIMRCKTLRELDFAQCAPDQGYVDGAANLENLVSLNLIDSCLDTSDFRGLERCKKLRFLNVHTSRVNNDALRSICKLANLLVLDISYNGISDETLKLLRNLKELRVLVMTHSPKITDTGMLTLAALPMLTHLMIDEGKVGDFGVSLLAQSKSLQYLCCDGKVTPQYAEELLRARRFKRLSYPNFDRKQIERLAGFWHLTAEWGTLGRFCWQEEERLRSELLNAPE